jgi:uncharacterized protein
VSNYREIGFPDLGPVGVNNVGVRVPARNEHLNIVGFLGLTALISSLFWTLIVSAGHVGAGAGLYVTGLMWSPALAAFCLVSVRHMDVRCLGLGSFGGRYAAIGYLVPLAYATIAYGLIWSFGFGFFPDPAAIATRAEHLGWHITRPAVFIALYFILMASTQILLSVTHALGEEIGWRGFLAPRLVARLGFTGGAILLGVIWAVWHLPILLFADYHSSTPWWFSVPCFCTLTIGLSIILTWLRLMSRSVWPCALLHASHNLFIQGFFTPLTGARGHFTPYLIDEFGVAVPGVILLFALGFWSMRRRIDGTSDDGLLGACES